MNKQEAIEKIEELKKYSCGALGDDWISLGIDKALNVVKQLDEPEKPVVPQFVADLYESIKDDLEYNLYKLCTDFREQKLREDFHGWFNDDNNKSIETLVLMHKFGYEVEKEKLYRAKNRHTGEYLCYCFEFFHDKNSSSENQRFTAEEKRWKELGYWGNDLYVFEEAEGGDE